MFWFDVFKVIISTYFFFQINFKFHTLDVRTFFYFPGLFLNYNIHRTSFFDIITMLIKKSYLCLRVMETVAVHIIFFWAQIHCYCFLSNLHNHARYSTAFWRKFAERPLSRGPCPPERPQARYLEVLYELRAFNSLFCLMAQSNPSVANNKISFIKKKHSSKH